MLDYLSDRPLSFIDEVALAVYDQFGVDISERAVYDYLARNHWSRKVVKEFAAQQSVALRALWAAKSAYWSMERLCFIDESAACERTGSRKRGWSPVGVSCTVLQTLRRSERYSVLPALTVNGYLPCTLIVKGGVTKSSFTWWVVNCLLPAVPPGTILVMDNASIHHNLGIEELLAVKGIQLEYLPPYSPDYNPIEATFHTLKKWVQRHFMDIQLYEDFEDFLRAGLAASAGGDCRQYFRHCGYVE
jgi:transposase